MALRKLPLFDQFKPQVFVAVSVWSSKKSVCHGASSGASCRYAKEPEDRKSKAGEAFCGLEHA